jgi:hypothetical protein
VPPNKNTTLGALGRAVGAVVNSLNPLNETKALSQGLGMYKSETAALIKGQSGIVTYVSSVKASPSPAGDLRCFVDPATGQLLGLEQSVTAACSVASDVVVVVPMSTGSYISQVKLAYTYDGAFVGRLVFELKDNATSKAVSYTCGSAGGKAVSLLPSDRDYAVSRLVVGCAPLPAIDGGSGGGGRRLQAAPGLGLSAGSFGVTAAPLSVLPVDPLTGIPLTQSLGDVLVSEPGPSPPGPPAPAPAVKVAYIVNNGDNTVTQCTITAGSITSCAVPALTSGAWNIGNPYDIAVANNVTYIPNLFAGHVTQCTITAGSITSCAVPTLISGSWNMNGPVSGAVVNDVAYFPNYYGNTVTQCTITAGSITSCAVPTLTSGSWNMNGPVTGAILNDVAYFPNIFADTVTQCTITAGSITSCTVPALTSGSWNLDSPQGIAIADNIAYIPNYDSNTVTQCTITAGSITSCAVPALTSGSWSMNGPNGIAIA